MYSSGTKIQGSYWKNTRASTEKANCLICQIMKGCESLCVVLRLLSSDKPRWKIFFVFCSLGAGIKPRALSMCYITKLHPLLFL